MAFRAFFCGEGGQVGSLQFPQRRSYFALALPHRVWLLGVDFQLEHDIDLPQLEHFERIVATMREGDRVVLCVPEPIWVHDFEQLMATAGSNPDGLDSMMRGEHPRLHTLLDALSSRGARPVAWLSGDLHHYRRHERGSVQHFTAGGGGAFTHPTHGWRDEGHPYAVQPTSYPSTRESFWLTFGNIAFLRKNWKFGLFTGAVYALVFMTLSSTLMGTKQLSLLAGLGTSFVSALDQPSAVLLIALTYLGFFAFTDTRGKWFRGVATLLHGSAHLGSALLLGLGASHFISIGREGPAEWFVRLVEKLTQTFALWASGFFVGPLIMGLYLLISLNLFRRHRNEAFSALRIADFGHFLRIVLAQDGSVTVHAVATPRTGEPRLIESVRLSD